MRVDKKVKICIQRADRLGDVILAIPVVDKIIENYPNAEVHFLTSGIGEVFLEQHPNITRVITCDVEHSWASVAYRSLVKTIRSESYDIFISLWNHPKMALLAKLSGASVSIGDATDPLLKRCYTHPVRQRWEDLTRHQIEFNLDLLAPLNIPSQLISGQIPIDPKTQDRVHKEVAKWINPSKKLILIFTGTGGTNEPIPEAAVADFIRLISEQEEFQVILAGQERQGSIFNSYTEHGALNFIGRTSLSELVSLIHACDYYVGPDTGPTHIASFFQKPMVFFSSMKPNPPARWGSLSPYQKIIRREYICDHFPKKQCNPKTCFGFVTGDLLYQHFGELLNQQSLNETKVGPALKTEHLKNTFRVLCPTSSIDEYNALFSASNSLREDGLVVFPYVVNSWGLSSIWFLIKKVAQHNISVIHGPVPFWVRWCIHLYIGAIYTYSTPLYISIPLLLCVDADDYVQLYKNEFSNVR